MKIIFEKKKKGLWANIHAKRERGESPAKPGEEGYPDKKQWDKLTKEELEQVVNEELNSILEAEQMDLISPESSEQAAKQAHDLVVAAQNNLKQMQATNKAAPINNPKIEDARKQQLRAAQLELQFARENEQKAKATINQADSVEKSSSTKPEITMEEEKSNFQREMERKGKGWKVRLLTKGKQSAGSAYPNKAPVDRAKSAPPGAGGV
jgi:hypothetical protein